MAYEQGNIWTKPTPEKLNIIIVGHRVKSRCAVGNILFRAPLYSQRSIFKYKGDNHRGLICQSFKLKHYENQLFNIVIAPDLRTDFWKTQLTSYTLKHVYTQKVFLYVTDAEGGLLYADDIHMEEIRKQFGYEKTWIIPIICCTDNPPDMQTLRDQTTWFKEKCYSSHVAPCFLLHGKTVKLMNGKDLIEIILRVIRGRNLDLEKQDECEVIQLGDDVTRITKFSEIFGDPSLYDVPVSSKSVFQTETKKQHDKEKNESLIVTKQPGPTTEKDKESHTIASKHEDTPSYQEPETRPGDINKTANVPTDGLEIKEIKIRYVKDENGQMRKIEEVIYERPKDSSSTLRGPSGRDETITPLTQDTPQTSRDHNTQEVQHNDKLILPLIKQEYVKKMTRETTMVKWQSRVLTEDDKERYVNALKYGKTRSFHVSVMVLGPNGAGKTTLIKRLQGEITKASSLTVPTQGLEISENRVRCVKDEDGQLVWEDQDEEFTDNLMAERMACAIRMNETLSRSTMALDQASDSVSSGQGIALPVFAQTVKTNTSSGSVDGIQRRDDVHLSVTEDNSKDETSDDQKSKQETEAKSLPREEKTSASKSYSLNDSNLEKAFVSLEHSRTEKLYFSFWDFAGQTAYYGTHQLFLTLSTLIILVVDFSKDLKEVLPDQSFGFVRDEFGKIEMTVFEAIQFWAQSIRTFTSKSERHIIVVCSHMDKVEKNSVSEKLNRLNMLIKDYVKPKYIFIDNTNDPDTDDDFQNLKISLHDMGLEQTRKEEFPTYWLELENILRNETLKDKKIISFKHASDVLSKRIGSGNKDADDIERLQSFFCYQHCKGRLLYFPQNRTRNTVKDEMSLVILDPTIVVKFLARIISGPKVSFETQLARGVQIDLHQDGIFDENYIFETIRSDNEMVGLKENLELILHHLETLHILCKYEEEGKMFYLMPCLLRSRSKSCLFHTALSRSTVIIIAFTPVCKHYSVFFQLMTALSREFEIMKEPSASKRRHRHVYRKCVCFYITQDKLLLLHLRMVDNDIYCEVINYGDQFKFGNDNEVARCGGLLETIKKELEKILDLYNVALTYEFRIICPKHSDPPNPSSLPIDVLQANGQYLCHPESGDNHEVKTSEILKDWFPIEDNNELPQVRDAEKQQQSTLTDKDIGRICLQVNKQDLRPCCLASKLEINYCYSVVDRIICDNQNNVKKQLLEVLFHWKHEVGDDKCTTKELARCLQVYHLTIYSLHQACIKRPRPQVITERESLNRTPTEEDLMKISSIIPASKMDFLFLELGLSKVDIDNTRSEAKNSTLATFKLFLKWSARKGYDMHLTDIALACFVMKITQPSQIINAIEDVSESGQS